MYLTSLRNCPICVPKKMSLSSSGVRESVCLDTSQPSCQKQSYCTECMQCVSKIFYREIEPVTNCRATTPLDAENLNVSSVSTIFFRFPQLLDTSCSMFGNSQTTFPPQLHDQIFILLSFIIYFSQNGNLFIA